MNQELGEASVSSSAKQRIACAAIAFALAAIVLFPWGQGFNPEGNWLRGPLWLLTVPSTADRLVGSVVGIPLLAAMVLPIVFRNFFACGLAAASAVAWVAFGAYLAMLAVI